MLRAETVGTTEPTTMLGAALKIDALWAENNRLRRKLEASSKANAVLTDACSGLRRELRSARADATFQKSRADGYIDELDGVGEMQTRVQELEAEARELRGES